LLQNVFIQTQALDEVHKQLGVFDTTDQEAASGSQAMNT
jgi:hypothetical protein